MLLLGRRVMVELSAWTVLAVWVMLTSPVRTHRVRRRNSRFLLHFLNFPSPHPLISRPRPLFPHFLSSFPSHFLNVHTPPLPLINVLKLYPHHEMNKISSWAAEEA